MVQAIIEIRSLSKGSFSAIRRKVQSALSVSFERSICKNVDLIYRLEGDYSSEEISKIAREILCDPVSERYLIDTLPLNKKTFFVDVWYKSGVTDAVGESLLKAIDDLGIGSIEKAFSGTRYELFIEENKDQRQSDRREKELIDFANKELLNPLIQECKILKF